VDMRELVRELMGEMSQAEFGEKVGITQAGVSAILLGKREVGAKVTRGLMLAFPEREREILASFFASDYASSSEDTPSAVPQEAPCQ
jgi:transcriptional regulator with XRE-family HTH domain